MDDRVNKTITNEEEAPSGSLGGVEPSGVSSQKAISEPVSSRPSTTPSTTTASQADSMQEKLEEKARHLEASFSPQKDETKTDQTNVSPSQQSAQVLEKKDTLQDSAVSAVQNEPDVVISQQEKIPLWLLILFFLALFVFLAMGILLYVTIVGV